MASTTKPAKQWPTMLSFKQTATDHHVGVTSSTDSVKLMNVSITVLSLAGVYMKESINSKKNTKKSTNTTSAKKMNPPTTTTVVASFPHNVDTSSQKTIMTHVPSRPLDLPPASSSDIFKDVIHWSDSLEASAVSTFQFQRYFRKEQKGNKKNSSPIRKNKQVAKDRFVPQSCPLQLAISRNGRMFKLGTVDILVSGEESGDASVSVPVVNHDRPIAKSSKTKRGNSESTIAMIRLKGETLKYGLADNATLRVLVHASEPQLVVDDESPQANMPPVKIMINRCQSEASWEYDPRQAAVVMKEKGERLKAPSSLNPRNVKDDIDVHSYSTGTNTTGDTFSYASSYDYEDSRCSTFSSGIYTTDDTVTSEDTDELMSAVMSDSYSEDMKDRKSRSDVEDETFGTSSTGSSSASFVKKTIFPQVNKAKSFGQRFFCGFPVCVGNQEKGTMLDFVNDDATILSSGAYALQCRKHLEMTDTASFYSESSCDDSEAS
jgi:hypothetical protein